MPVFRTREALSASPTGEPKLPTGPDRPRQVLERRGTSAVEFALVAPALFLFILGIIELGRGFMVAHLLCNAARVGCRAGVIPGTSTASIQERVKATLEAQGVVGASTKVYVNGNADIDAAAAQSTDTIAVEVLIPVSQFTWLPGGQLLKGNLGGRHMLQRE